MSITAKHIALLLLSVFTITIIPFNALHHHEEDEHLAAILFHTKAEHSCELDNHFCQPNINNHHCEHQSHVAAPISKCLSCEFHFIKHFEQNDLFVYEVVMEISSPVIKPVQTRLRTALLDISNKGPPSA